MATGFTRREATEILQEVVKGSYVALSTTTPDQDGNNFTEPAYSTGYLQAPFGDLDTSILGQVSNAKTIFLFEATKDIGSVTYAGLEKSGIGICLMVKLSSALPITAGYVPLIRRHGFVIGLDKDELEAYPD